MDDIVFETNRLIIRSLTEDEINRFNTRNLGKYNNNEFSIVLKSNNEKIGSIGYSNIDDNTLELRYGIKSDYQSSGYMSETISEFIDYLWKQDIGRIVIVAKTDNIASNKIACKNNFELIKTFLYKDFGMCNYYELKK